jgi:cytidylate kinase
MKDCLKIGIVGPCAAGKSTLIAGLQTYGYQARHITQEHSYVPDMWRKLVNPEILIYLDVSYRTSIKRKNLLSWTETDYVAQVKRLNHARTYANIYINTDELSAQEVLERIIKIIIEKYNMSKTVERTNQSR